MVSDAPRRSLVHNPSGAPEDLFGQKELPRLKTIIYQSDHPSTPPAPIAPSIQTLALHLPRLTCAQTISTVANYVSLVPLVIKSTPWSNVSLPVHIVLPALTILVTDSPALLANFATPSLLKAKFEDVTDFAWRITPLVTPMGSNTFTHMGCLLSLDFTNCDVSFVERITPLLEAAQTLRVLGITACRNADLLLSELLMSRLRKRSDPHIPEPDPAVDRERPRNNRQQRWKIPLLSLKQINFQNNTFWEETHVPQMVIDLLQNRGDSLHVKTDLVKCREICLPPPLQ